MLFIILFFISILGILFLYTKERKKKNITLLHYVKKSCNIDSVQFERGFKKTRYTIFKKISNLEKPLKTFLKKLHLTQHTIVKHGKKSIRKKLFQNDSKQVSTSRFISEMKEPVE